MPTEVTKQYVANERQFLELGLALPKHGYKPITLPIMADLSSFILSRRSVSVLTITYPVSM